MHAPGPEGARAERPRRTRRACSIAAIHDPNPVLFFEHKHLYRRVKEEVPAGRYETPMTRARRARAGSDLTVIAYGAMVWSALEATEDIEGASIEVLDLRSLVPLDEAAILESVRTLLEGGDRGRGERDLRGGRAGRGADRRARASRTSTARSCGSPRPTCRSRSRRRSNRRCCRRWTTSGRRAVSSSSTESGAQRSASWSMPQMGVSVAEGTLAVWHKRGRRLGASATR